MITVRPFQEGDLPRLREICLETSSFKKNDEKTTAFLYLMFCDYYALCEPESVFVAADEHDKAQGYILCAKDFNTYRKRFRAFFQPDCDKLGPYFFGIVRGEMFVHGLFARQYPMFRRFFCRTIVKTGKAVRRDNSRILCIRDCIRIF